MATKQNARGNDMIKILLVILSVLCATPCSAAVKYVSSTGAAAWGDCGVSTSPCSVTTANANATAGDTVYLLDGTYTTTLSPVNSGTTNDYIYFMAYPGHTPTISSSAIAFGVELSGVSWIYVKGIKVTKTSGTYFGFVVYNWAHHCVIDSCETDGTGVTTTMNTGLKIYADCPGGYSGATCTPTNIWVKNSKFSNHGYISYYTGGLPIWNCGDVAGSAYIGSTGASDYTKNITIENCVFSRGGHHAVEHYATHSVFRNNHINNPGWMDDPAEGGCTCTPSPRNGKYGNRVMQLYDGRDSGALYNLVEGNRFGNDAKSPDTGEEGAFTLTAPGNILRYNRMYNSEESGLSFKCGGSSYSNNNQVYNNTIYYSGYNSSISCNTLDYRYGISMPYALTTQGNVIANNLVYLGYTGDVRNYEPTRHEFKNNWYTTDGDPLLIGTNLANIDSLTQPELLLHTNSDVISGATCLAHTSNAGAAATGVSVVVGGVTAFQDGTIGADISGIQADWVAIGSVTNIAQIDTVDVATNTLNLKTALTWSSGDSIWLYKKSDGVRVLYGTAPDIGADEYNVDLWQGTSKKMRGF